MSAQGAGGAGKWFGSGHVYVNKDVAEQKFKIGCSKDPEKRLHQIQKDLAPNQIVHLRSFEAREMNRAETAAQAALKQQLGMEKDRSRGNATDWFVNQGGVSDTAICRVVEKAVAQHNAAK